LILQALERYLPAYRYTQDEVAAAVREWLGPRAPVARLLKVYAAAGVRQRASILPIDEVFAGGDFESRNDRYCEAARSAAIELTRQALGSAGLLPREIDAIVSVSCTGFQIPAVEAHVADVLGMGPRLMRLPVTESGCAGGVVGLARAADFLAAHPDRAVLLLAIEFASVTFQGWDRSPANVVSTALFGDGGAAAVLLGADHPLAGRGGLARLSGFESLFFPGTTHLMGFRLRNQGLQIVLDRGLAAFVKRAVRGALSDYLKARGLGLEDIGAWALHPGGRRIVDAMAEELGLAPGDLAATEAVLASHGNMSSVTVLFILDEILRSRVPGVPLRGLIGAFGPGFGAELGLFEAA
jgi:alkylresorcinol/alkylpyrone synthase